MLATALLSGCSLVSDLDRFEEGAGGTGGTGGGGDDGGPGDGDAGLFDGGTGPTLGCANPQTLCVRLEDWPHLTQLAVIDLVTNDDNNLRSRAMLEPFGIGGDAAEIVLPLAIPETEVPDPGDDHPLHLEIWADAKEDGEYTPDADHDWEVELPADGNVVFVHNAVFKDLLPRPRGAGGDFAMRFRDMKVHAGRMFELMVIEDASGRTVGFTRVQEVPDDGEFEVFIPGIIDPGGIVYRIEFFADADERKNRTYDDPPTDHAWVVLAESNDKGLDIPFTHMGAFSKLAYQFRFE